MRPVTPPQLPRRKCLRVLIACESSGEVRRQFRLLGHDAWSCDLLPAEDHSHLHITGDALAAIRAGRPHTGMPWDLVIGHPPCTHLSSSGARWWPEKRADGRQQAAIRFVLDMVQACRRVGAAWAIENPVGILSTVWRKPDQIIQPWQYGHGEVKTTCLWLEKIPPLTPTRRVTGREQRCWKMPESPNRWRERSRTYRGIARAMARQWSAALLGG